MLLLGEVGSMGFLQWLYKRGMILALGMVAMRVRVCEELLVLLCRWPGLW